MTVAGARRITAMDYSLILLQESDEAACHEDFRQPSAAGLFVAQHLQFLIQSGMLSGLPLFLY